MQVRVRLGPGLARLAPSPLVSLELEEGATVADACRHLAAEQPRLAAALGAALPVISGVHAERGHPLAPGDELALLTPVAGG
jgi:molybdopterin converting factor small subunit